MTLDLFTIALISPVPAIILGLIYFKTLNFSLRVLFFFLLTAFIIDSFGIYLVENNIHNLWLFNLYTLIEFAFYAFFYYTLFKGEKEHVVLTVFSVVFVLLTYITFNPVTGSFTEKINEITMGIESIVFISTSTLYFSVILKRLEYATPWENPFFWINSAILIYFSSSFFVFIFSGYRDYSELISLWDIHSVIRIIANLIFLLGFWKAQKI